MFPGGRTSSPGPDEKYQLRVGAIKQRRSISQGGTERGCCFPVSLCCRVPYEAHDHRSGIVGSHFLRFLFLPTAESTSRATSKAVAFANNFFLLPNRGACISWQVAAPNYLPGPPLERTECGSSRNTKRKEGLLREDRDGCWMVEGWQISHPAICAPNRRVLKIEGSHVGPFGPRHVPVVCPCVYYRDSWPPPLSLRSPLR